MKFKGFKDVHHVKGGIIEYLNQVRKNNLENNFIGKNFVFDERLGEKITDEIISTCDVCKKNKSDDYYNCKKNTCSKLFLACPTCLKTKKNFCSTKCKFLNIFAKHKG
jgi:UPF0176 protein